MTPYLVAVAGFSSTLSFTIFTLPFMAPAISSSAGAIIRQGPHHSAQKSTTTGSADFKTSASNVASDTLLTPMGMPRFVLLVRGIAPVAEGRWSESMERRRERQGMFTGV